MTYRNQLNINKQTNKQREIIIFSISTTSKITQGRVRKSLQANGRNHRKICDKRVLTRICVCIYVSKLKKGLHEAYTTSSLIM